MDDRNRALVPLRPQVPAPIDHERAERIRQLRAELAADNGAYPEAIKIEPGDVLIGRLVRYGKAHSVPYGDGAHCVILDEETGKPVTLWLTHTSLRGLFRQIAPVPGETIALKRFDDAPPPKKAARYRLDVVERPTALLADRVVDAEFEDAKGGGR